MAQLRLAKNLKTALKDAGSVIVMAQDHRFGPRKLPKLLPPGAQKMLADVAKDVEAGDAGGSATTLTGGTPRRVTAAVLPSTASRYNHPVRPDAIERLVIATVAGKEKRLALVFVLEEAGYATAAALAISQALPGAAFCSGQSPETRVALAFVGPDGKDIEVDDDLQIILDAQRTAASLVDAPPTELGPENFEVRATKLLKALKNVSIKVLRGEELLKNGLGGIYAVGKAATEAPRMLVATYKPPKGSGRKVALVGKGVCFDTGGLHLKPRGGMETMKMDMGGAAATLGAFLVLAQTGCEHTVSLILCLVENAIGPGAFKPDDILYMHSGKTVEVNNTDAEGRLLLADGVSWACKQLKASVVLDAATLTGAQLIATGIRHAAVVTNDQDLEDLLVESAYATGDFVHPLPFAPELFQSEFKSPVADMRNSVKNRANAQTSCAAQFVFSHVSGADTLWGHIDLAGPAFRNNRGTGFGVALIADTVRGLE